MTFLGKEAGSMTEAADNIKRFQMNSVQNNFKQRCAEILDPGIENDFLTRGFNIFIIILIILNVLAVMLESVKELTAVYGLHFRIFDAFSVAVFTIEYVFRLWTCTLKEKFQHPIKGRVRYALTPLALIDLLAILPFYLQMFVAVDLRALRMLRMFRILKITRYSKSLGLIVNVIREKKEELLVAFGVTMALLVLASGIIFYLEHAAQPDAFSSIPAAMWWGVATMTTVGYGDMYPITTLGKVFGGFVSCLGLGTFGLPVGIIAYGFIEEIQKRKFRPASCPHCGKDVDLPIERRKTPRI